MTERRPGGEQLPTLERTLLRFASRLAPRRARDGWLAEWTAEVWFARRSGRDRVRVVWRAGWSWMDSVALWRREVDVAGWSGDLRMAVRSAVRSPMLSAVVVLTLGVGVGVGSAMFGIVSSVLWSDLDLPEPEQLFRISQERPANGQVGWGYSWAMLRNLGDGMSTAELAGYSGFWFDVRTDDGPVRVAATRVTHTFFPVLGISFEMGRSFTAEEEASGQAVVVVSHDFWRNVLGSDPNVLGRTIALGTGSYEIVGVVARGDWLLAELNRAGGVPFGPTNVYMPLETFGAAQAEMTSTIQALGRLRPGVELQQAEEEAFRLQDTFLTERGATGWRTEAIGLKEYLVQSSRPALLVLLAAVAALLAMVCANLGGLILVRGTTRGQEWAARRALGASRLRIARQLLAEGGFLALLGTGLGLGVAVGLTGLVARNAPAALPRAAELSIDLRAFAFSFFVTGCAALLFTALPASSAGRSESGAILRTNRQTMSRGARRTLEGLVALQVTLAVVLLAGSGVLLRSLANLLDQDPGYETHGVLQASVELPTDVYPSDAEVAEYARTVTERLGAVPGAEAVAVGSTTLPVQGPRIQFQMEDRPGEDGIGGAMQVGVSPEYFEVMRITATEGRLFAPADVDGPGVAVITPALARRYWPDGDAVGKRVSIGSWRTFGTLGTSTPPVTREIVGVTEDLSASGIDPGPPVEMLFAPMQQDPWRQQAYLVRTQGDPAALTDAVRSAIAEVDPARAVYDVVPLIEEQRQAIDRERVTTIVVIGFGLSALLLSGLGIYGVVAYSVTLRRREIGVRLALGARCGAVSRRFAIDGLSPVLLGTVSGMLVAVGAVRLLTGLLYQVEPLDPWSFAGATAVLAGAAIASAYLPAKRAAKVDPVEAMRV